MMTAENIKSQKVTIIPSYFFQSFFWKQQINISRCTSIQDQSYVTFSSQIWKLSARSLRKQSANWGHELVPFIWSNASFECGSENKETCVDLSLCEVIWNSDNSKQALLRLWRSSTPTDKQGLIMLVTERKVYEDAQLWAPTAEEARPKIWLDD